jgi:hypothetical protein
MEEDGRGWKRMERMESVFLGLTDVNIKNQRRSMEKVESVGSHRCDSDSRKAVNRCDVNIFNKPTLLFETEREQNAEAKPDCVF